MVCTCAATLMTSPQIVSSDAPSTTARLRVTDFEEWRLVRPRARRDDERISLDVVEFALGNIRTVANRNVQTLQFTREPVTEHPPVLAMRRRASGVELPADMIRTFVHRYVVTAQCRDACGGHAGRARADHPET